MTFSEADILSLVDRYLFTLFRIAAFVMVAPILGSHVLPARAKMVLAIALTVIIAPAVHIENVIDPFSLNALSIVIVQVLIGLAVGFCLSLLFSIIVMAGQLVAQLMGLSFASMYDPQYGISVPLIGQFYTLISTLIFLSINGHLIVVEMLSATFIAFPVDAVWPSATVWHEIVKLGTHIFSGAVYIAMPMMVALLIVNYAFGVMSRASPQLNIFAVGFPVMIIFGFLVMLAALPIFIDQFMVLIEKIFGGTKQIFNIL